MVPRTVLTRSSPISLNTARPVNTVQPRTTVNNEGPIKNVINNAYSTARRPFNKITSANNSNFTKKVNTVKDTRVNTARPVNTVQPRTTVNNAGPIKNVINNAYSTARRPFNKITAANNSNFTKKVNTVKDTRVNTARPKTVLSVVKGNKGNVGNAQQDLKDKRVIDSGCSRHMTGNKSYLIDYDEINGEFVAFGGTKV
ncbi:hypothetical protein Tco_0847010 [Tanacetum coccineum]